MWVPDERIKTLQQFEILSIEMSDSIRNEDQVHCAIIEDMGKELARKLMEHKKVLIRRKTFRDGDTEHVAYYATLRIIVPDG